MELSPVIVMTLAFAVVVMFMVLRWARRNSAPSPERPSVAPARRSVMNGGSEREELVQRLLERATEQTGFNVAGDSLARGRIEEAAAKAIDELGASTSTTISLPFLVADAHGPKHFAVDIRRNPDATFELQS